MERGQLPVAVSDGFVDVVARSVDDRVTGHDRAAGLKPRIRPIFVKRDHLGDLHRIDDAFTAARHPHDDVADLGSLSDQWLAACQRQQAVERVWGEARVVNNDI